MFHSNKLILYIKRNNIKFAIISDDNAALVKNNPWQQWDNLTLEGIIKQIVNSSPSKRIYLLLGDDLVYAVQVALPISTKDIQERDEIYKHIKDQIPEILDSNGWDYFELGVQNNSKQIVAVAPVKDIFQKISDILHTINCHVEVVEPEAIAKTRNQDPIIGITLRNNSERGLGQLLNLQLFNPQQKISKKTNDENNPTSTHIESGGSPMKTTYFIALLAIFILGIIAVSGTIYFQSLNQSRNVSSHQAKSTITPTMSSEKHNVDVSQLKVSVLNGSNVVESHTLVVQLLQQAGFRDIQTANADKFDYQNTEIYMKKTSNEAQIQDLLKNVLVNYHAEIKNPLQDDNNYDLLIIVGNNYEKTP